MTALRIKPSDGLSWDLVSLGEVMLRLDPGDERIATARTFRAWEGGGEYNVARGLTRCFGMRTTIVTRLVDNPIGRLIEDLMRQGGVDLSHVGWIPFDGTGTTVRNGLNFAERGFGLRAGMVCYDRANTAIAQLKPGEVDWEKLFGEEGVRWFHTGGIFAALSPNTAQAVIEAVKVARKYGTVVSYDLNYRASLWKSQGGKPGAQKINREIAQYVDVMIGNEEDFTACLGFEVEGLDEHISAIDPANFKTMIATAVRDLLVPDGFSVDTPAEPRSALVETIREAPDLVILDVNMPGMTGWEFCAILRRQTSTREVPVLFLTGRSEVKDRITAMQLGGSDFLAKPFGAEELRRKVRSLLDEPDTMEAG